MEVYHNAYWMGFGIPPIQVDYSLEILIMLGRAGRILVWEGWSQASGLNAFNTKIRDISHGI